MSTQTTLPVKPATPTTTQAVVKFEDRLENALTVSVPQMAGAFAKHLTPERMIRVTMQAIYKTPALKECDPQTIVASVIEAGSLGLEPCGPKRQGYLIPWKNKNTGTKECQFMPSYIGLIELARRSGQVKTISGQVVYSGDKFEYRRTSSGPHFAHEPNLDNPGTARAYYAVAEMIPAGVEFEVMTKPQIEDIRKRSQSANSGPWVTDYDEMAKKTVIKRLLKRLPMSDELADVIHREDGFIVSEEAIGAVTRARADELISRLASARSAEVIDAVEVSE